AAFFCSSRRRHTRSKRDWSSDVCSSDLGRVGGGGGAGVPLPGWAISLDEQFAKPLRTGSPAILPRVSDGRCLLDLRCVPESDDAVILERLKALMDGDGA